MSTESNQQTTTALVAIVNGRIIRMYSKLFAVTNRKIVSVNCICVRCTQQKASH